MSNYVYWLQRTDVQHISSRIEKEGLHRALTALGEGAVNISAIVVDDNTTIAQYLKTNHPHITVYRDNWHIKKG